jgi:glycogen(starch) synthase
VSRILLTTDVVGGVWDFCLVVAEGLRDAGHVVTLLAIGSPTLRQHQAAQSTGAEVVSAPLKLEWMQDSEADVGATRRLVADVARMVRADIVHANQFAAACADVDVPVIMTLHSDVLSWRRWTLGSTDVPPEWEPYVSLVREALTRADHVAAVSRFLAHEVRSLYGVDRRIEVIHNGWPALQAPVTPREPIALAAGRAWDPAKNVSLIAEAASGWDTGGVYLAGECTHPDGGRVSPPPPLKSLGFLSRVDLDEWLARTTIYVSAARYDPFGLLPLQAALHGCALLLSDIPSYRELWEGAAWFFRSNDADDLRQQWQRLLRTTHLPVDAGERARSLFTPRRMVDAYQQLYSTVEVPAAA